MTPMTSTTHASAASSRTAALLDANRVDAPGRPLLSELRRRRRSRPPRPMLRIDVTRLGAAEATFLEFR